MANRHNLAAKVQQSGAHPPILANAANSAIVHFYHGQLMVDSLTLAREFGRRHDNVLQSLDKLIFEGTINRLDFKVVEYLDQKGEKRRAIKLTERGALIAMPFIVGKKARQVQARFVDAFFSLRDKLPDPSDNKLEARRALAASEKKMKEALVATRLAASKPTEKHHFINEIRLVSTACFGKPDVDRASLTLAELGLLEKVEVENTSLITSNFTYPERKEVLIKNVVSLHNQAATLQGEVVYGA